MDGKIESAIERKEVRTLPFQWGDSNEGSGEEEGTEKRRGEKGERGRDRLNQKTNGENDGGARLSKS